MQLFDDDFVAILPGEKANTSTSTNYEKRASSNPPESMCSQQNGSKACLFTLLAYSKNFEQSIRGRELVRLIAKKYPCKIILLTINQTTSDTFEIERTIYKNSANSSFNTFIGELVSITSSPDQSHRVQFSLLPEIIPDLPVYVITSDRPSQCEQFFTPLLTHISKFIFEPDSINGYPILAQEVTTSSHSKKYVDINWIRLKQWREIIFRVFDDREKVKQIQYASNIQLRYAKHSLHTSDAHRNIQAIYLQAWLSKCLDWKMISLEQKEDRYHISFSHDKGLLSFDIAPFDSHVVEEGEILSLEITGVDKTHYLITHEDDDRHVVVHSSSTDRCEIPFVLFVGSFLKGHYLGQELFTGPIEDTHYIDTLQQFLTPEWKKTIL